MKDEFVDLLARFADVRAAFVRHVELKVPESVLPEEGEARVLSYGLDMPVPIPDLEITDAGISATLSFSRSPRKTFVPWDAVVGVRGYFPKPKPRPRLSLVP